MNNPIQTHSSKKSWGIMLLMVLALGLVIGGIKGYQTYTRIQGFKNMGVPKQTVSTATVGLQSWQPQLHAVGTLRAVRGADISAEVAGIVDKISFESGASVKQGTPLLTLRGTDDVAKLDSLKANLQLATANYKRDQAQLKAQAISQAQLDNSAAMFKSAQAQVAEQKALLNKKHIVAPFAGTLGVRNVDIGQYLQPGTKIVTLQTLDPILVDFFLPQQSLGQVAVGEKLSIGSDTFPDAHFDGEVSAIDAKVDAETRNVQIRALVKNPQHKLLPGMYVNVDIDIGSGEQYLTIPQNAVSFNPYGETVFVIITADQYKSGQQARADSTAHAADLPSGLSGNDPVSKQVFVTVGPARGDQIAIFKGIKAGDRIVTSGQLKLKNGSPVEINDKVQPLDNPDPKPIDE